MIFPLKPWNLLRPCFIGIFQLATFDYRVRMVSNFWHLLEVSRPWGNSKHGGFCTAIGYTGTNHIDTTNYMYNISQYISIYTYNYITLYLTLFKTIKKNKSKHMWISIFIQQLKYIYIYIYIISIYWNYFGGALFLSRCPGRRGTVSLAGLHLQRRIASWRTMLSAATMAGGRGP